jgi:hypothetical protein
LNNSYGERSVLAFLQSPGNLFTERTLSVITRMHHATLFSDGVVNVPTAAAAELRFLSMGDYHFVLIFYAANLQILKSLK